MTSEPSEKPRGCSTIVALAKSKHAFAKHKCKLDEHIHIYRPLTYSRIVQASLSAIFSPALGSLLTGRTWSTVTEPFNEACDILARPFPVKQTPRPEPCADVVAPSAQSSPNMTLRDDSLGVEVPRMVPIIQPSSDIQASNTASTNAVDAGNAIAAESYIPDVSRQLPTDWAVLSRLSTIDAETESLASDSASFSDESILDSSSISSWTSSVEVPLEAQVPRSFQLTTSYNLVSSVTAYQRASKRFAKLLIEAARPFWDEYSDGPLPSDNAVNNALSDDCNERLITPQSMYCKLAETVRIYNGAALDDEMERWLRSEIAGRRSVGEFYESQGAFDEDSGHQHFLETLLRTERILFGHGFKYEHRTWITEEMRMDGVWNWD